MAVSIPLTVVEKIMSEAKATDKEIIGLLIGEYKDGIIFINESVSGEQESETAHVTLFSKTTAKIVDKIMKKEIDGLIMGWYHSHPGYGIFMSQTDIQTQSKFQQFSDNVIAIVLEPTKMEMGIFSLDCDGQVYQFDEDSIHVYKEGEEKVTPALIAAAKKPKAAYYGPAPMPHLTIPMAEQPEHNWQPLPSKQRAVAERKLALFKNNLTRGYKMGILTKRECQQKLRSKEIQLRLRPPDP